MMASLSMAYILLLLLASKVHAIPASPSPGQLINAGSDPATSAPLNSTAPGIPFVYPKCSLYRPAPLQDCMRALAQFPKGGDGEFHPPRPHDPNPDYALGQVKKSGQCRIFVDLLGDASGRVTPTIWYWDGPGGLTNDIKALLETCMGDQSTPIAQRVTGGDSYVSLLHTISPGFKISVRKTAYDEEEEAGGVDLAE